MSPVTGVVVGWGVFLLFWTVEMSPTYDPKPPEHTKRKIFCFVVVDFLRVVWGFLGVPEPSDVKADLRMTPLHPDRRLRLL